MTYASLEKQIQAVPEEYLGEVAEFIEYILFKAQKSKSESDSKGTFSYFGSLKIPFDALEYQRNLRNEWN